MSMTLGRFSTSEDPDAGSLRQSGDIVEFESMIVGADLNEFKARVQQLRGLVDNDDERVFPFTWSEDSTFDGFYADIEVEVQDQAAMLASFAAPFSVRMRRVTGGFAVPLAETIVSSVIRTNAHSVASGNSHLVVPPQTDAPGSWYASGANTAMNSEDGSLFRNTRTAPVATIALTSGVLPADWYKGGARVSLSYGGTYYPVVGQQIPRVQAVRIQNANFRFDVSSTAVITLSMYHDAAWESSPSFTLNQSGAFNSVGSVKILRNGPDVVVVRLSLLASAAVTSPCTLDVALHRGHQTACCVFTPHGLGTGSTLSIRASAVTAVTAITGGIEQTTADAAGNKWFILSASAATNDLTNGYRTTSAAVAAREAFALGMRAGSTVSGDWTTDARESFWCEYAESTRVVSR